MTEAELRERFENLTLRPEEFPHEAHLRLAWTYLCELPLIEVLKVFPENLKRFARSIGKPGLYHETITFAFLTIIAERIERGGERASWSRFIDANRDLLRGRELLARYYDSATLESDLARRTFLFPTRH